MNGSYERIYRIWSDKREDHLAVRVQFTIEQTGACRFVRLGEREEWSC